MNEFDFNGGDIVLPPPRRAGGWEFKRRALRVVACVGLLAALTGVIIERDFWWLWLTGRRATATVTGRQEHVIGWAFTRMSAANGQAYPIVQTEYRYSSCRPDGTKVGGAIRVCGPSQEWAMGDSLAVMYPRFGGPGSMPSSLSFYAAKDRVWLTLLVGAAVGLVTFVGCCLALGAISRAGEAPANPASPARGRRRHEDPLASGE
jgi:hypothetical protein